MHVQVRFYAELNDFLRPERRGRDIAVDVAAGTTVKDLIESLGVPHTEVEVILVEGRSVDFGYKVSDAERVSVYPVFESFEISPVFLRPAPLREPRFVLDVHLGRLARHLRLLGFDAKWTNDADDEDLASASVSEARILLTKDIGLLKRRMITRGYYVRETSPRLQVTEVLRRFDLHDRITPFSRCLECNSELSPATKEDAMARVPSRVLREHDTFSRCPRCGRIYWRGSHYDRLAAFVEQVRADNGEDPPLHAR